MRRIRDLVADFADHPVAHLLLLYGCTICCMNAARDNSPFWFTFGLVGAAGTLKKLV